MTPTANAPASTVVAPVLARARRAQAEWAALPLAQRLAALRRLARVLTRERERIVRAIRDDTSKPRTEALAEIAAGVELVLHYANTAPRVLRTQWVDTGPLVGKSACVIREPLGVIGIITPWNYPYLLTQDAVTAAIAAGNGAVVKPSEFTPTASHLVAEAVERAGLPAGLVQVVEGDGSVGEALVESGVDRVVFTGSTATGRRVMEAAARRLVPVTLELGGKDPALVLADADLDRAARGVAFGAFFNAGQTCISTERAYVHTAVFESFVDRVVEVVDSLRWDGSAGATDLGPMVTPAQWRIVRDQLGEAAREGARFRAGGIPADDGSRVIPPTVVTDLPAHARLLREETFGPVLPIVRVRDEDEAIARANDTPFGLFASVWTRDEARGREVARRLRAGGVSINDTLSHYAVPGLPMGGVGDSGFGVRRGDDGLREMTRPRTIFQHRWGLRREPWWFPYTPRTERLVEALLVIRGEGWMRGLSRAWRVLARGGGVGGEHGGGG